MYKFCIIKPSVSTFYSLNMERLSPVLFKKVMENSCLPKRPLSSQTFTSHTSNKDTAVAEATDGKPIQFDDYQKVFEYKDTSEIVRALFVLKLCSFDGIVNNGEKLMKIGKSILGERLYTKLQKKTVYGQFVGGNNYEELTRKVQLLQAGGIGPILAVPMEDDATKNNDFNTTESQFDKNMTKTIECMDIVSNLNDPIPTMQVKLTALIPGDICTKMSACYAAPTKENQADIEDFAAFFQTENMPNVKNFTTTEKRQLEAGLYRLKNVFQKGRQKGIWLMVDAEYTYMNPALNLLTLAMMLNYNSDIPVVAYTYQNYLKGMNLLLREDIDYIKAHGVCFSAKLVRGAYMEKERLLAKKYGYSSPVNNTYEETTETYYKSLDIVLEETAKSRNGIRAIVATHNESTILHAVERMRTFGIDKQDRSIVFGQVDGMGDQVSYGLGRCGYLVYKSIPYGSIDDTLPYLLRRLLENRSVLNGVRRERELLSSALKHRFKQKCRTW